ncbi:hypothetical protein F5883DRAFT_86476 [Diaporthe sp. PMI_573]|nr:hypothetical protein F5883DRAFT_86476 [Diaporthaceae sp. PMI_573]
MPARNPDPAQGLITAGKGCQACRSGSDIVIRPASRPLASCQSLVYSFPRDAMWRSWAASCLWLLFLIPVPLARHPRRWLLFPPHRALLLPQKGCTCAARRRLHPSLLEVAPRRIDAETCVPKKDGRRSLVPVQPASEHTEVLGQIRSRPSFDLEICILGEAAPSLPN